MTCLGLFPTGWRIPSEVESTMKTPTWQASVLLGAANLVLLLACVIFASGFFPYKPFLSGLAEYKTSQWGSPPEAQFDKVVFMVVDALRR